MKIKREVFIAIVVGCIMIITCVLVIAGQRNVSKPVSIKVYKLYETTNEQKETSYYYSECSLNTDDLLKIKKEFKRSLALNDSKIINGKTIKGSYKVMMDDQFVAFDNKDDNLIYNGSKNKIYNFTSGMYEIVVNTCE